jgi:hypothetical protein
MFSNVTRKFQNALLVWLECGASQVCEEGTCNRVFVKVAAYLQTDSVHVTMAFARSPALWLFQYEGSHSQEIMYISNVRLCVPWLCLGG